VLLPELYSLKPHCCSRARSLSVSRSTQDVFKGMSTPVSDAMRDVCKCMPTDLMPNAEDLPRMRRYGTNWRRQRDRSIYQWPQNSSLFFASMEMNR
jgi:hypothetical protein